LAGDLDAADELLQAAYAKVYPRWEKVRTYDVPDAYLRKVMVATRSSPRCSWQAPTRLG